MRISEEIFPRVCALICSNDGKKDNVMTASFLMPISFEPKYLAFSLGPQRYTFLNLKKVPEFTLNILEEQMQKVAEICGSFSGRDVDKFKEAGIHKEKSKKVKPPMIKESPISFECEVVYIEKFGDHYLVVGKVVNEVIRKKEFAPLLHKTGKIFPKIK
jgi:flavin reductase (DIM6/NTAB) family NADH-FMN oxidoreductase RutF